MATAYPCPNPTCTQIFASDAVAGVASLTCPRCGTVFQFRKSTDKMPSAASSKAPSPSNAPLKKGPPPPPPSTPVGIPPLPASKIPPPPAATVPVAPAVPVAAPPRSAPAALTFDQEPGKLVNTGSRQRRKRGGNSFFLGLSIFLFISGCLAMGVYLGWDTINDWLDRDSFNNSGFRTTGNFGLKAPSGWRNDRKLREKMKANVAVSHGNPRAHMVLYFRDLQTRGISDGELLDVALTRLRSYFPRMEYINPFLSEKRGRTDQLDGVPAIVFRFSATDPSDVPMTGQCYMLSRQGYAYWLIFWGPDLEAETLPPYFETLREGFKLFNERNGWKPTPRKTIPFTTSTLACTLHFADEVWDKEDNPTEADSAAELALRGYEPTEDAAGRKKVVKYAGKAATVVVLSLPKAAGVEEAAKKARDHIEKRIKDINPQLKIEPVLDRTGKPIISREVGAMRGKVERLRLLPSPDTEQFGVLAVVNRTSGVLAIYCECKFSRRDYWEEEFTSILATVRPGSGR